MKYAIETDLYNARAYTKFVLDYVNSSMASFTERKKKPFRCLQLPHDEIHLCK